MQSWVLGAVCNAGACQGAFPAELYRMASDPRPAIVGCSFSPLESTNFFF